MSRRFRHAFTVLELLVVIAVLSTLVMLVATAISRFRIAARTVECANNLRQIGLAIHHFLGSHGRMPDAAEVFGGLQQFHEGHEAVFRCPEAVLGGTGEVVSYGVNPCVRSQTSDADKVILVDAHARTLDYESLTPEEWDGDVAPRHAGVMNVLFGDGRVDRRTADDINPYLAGLGDEIRRRCWMPRRPGCTCDPVGEHGLLGEYWRDPQQWAGPVVRRIEKTITLPFGNLDFYGIPYNVPLPGSTPSYAWPLKTATFSGLIRADRTEPVTFHVCCDNEAWVYVNGQLVVSRSTGGPGPVQMWQAAFRPIDLRAGQWVDFEVRWRELHPTTPSHIMVQWSSPSFPCRTQIPLRNMRPPRWWTPTVTGVP